MENKINNFIKTNNLRLLNNLTELDDIKVVLIDAYGVFWDGSKIIEKTVSDMKNLIQKDIMVVVISNTTQISSKAIESYKKRGMYLGEHFNYFITSGELFKHYVEAGNIKNLIFLKKSIKLLEDEIKILNLSLSKKEEYEQHLENEIKEKIQQIDLIINNIKNEFEIQDINLNELDTKLELYNKYNIYQTKLNLFNDIIKSLNSVKLTQVELKQQKTNKQIKIYIHGAPNTELFSGEKGEKNFIITTNFDEADAVYLGIPQYTQEEIDNILVNLTNFDKKNLKKSTIQNIDKKERFDSIDLELFKPFIDKCKDKIILNANPDKTASEKDANTGEKNQVVRNGMITEEMKKRDYKIIEIGKPNKEIFDFALKKTLETKQFNTSIEELKQQTVMVGDTIETDIKGAEESGIKRNILVLGSGSVSSKKIEEDKLKQLDNLLSVNNELFVYLSQEKMLPNK